MGTLLHIAAEGQEIFRIDLFWYTKTRVNKTTRNRRRIPGLTIWGDDTAYGLRYPVVTKAWRITRQKLRSILSAGEN